MQFIVLAKMRHGISKESAERTSKTLKEPPPGVKIHSVYWTLGRYDAVLLVETVDEKALMAFLLPFGDDASTETLIAVPQEEALTLL